MIFNAAGTLKVFFRMIVVPLRKVLDMMWSSKRMHTTGAHVNRVIVHDGGLASAVAGRPLVFVID